MSPPFYNFGKWYTKKSDPLGIDMRNVVSPAFVCRSRHNKRKLRKDSKIQRTNGQWTIGGLSDALGSDARKSTGAHPQNKCLNAIKYKKKTKIPCTHIQWIPSTPPRSALSLIKRAEKQQMDLQARIWLHQHEIQEFENAKKVPNEQIKSKIEQLTGFKLLNTYKHEAVISKPANLLRPPAKTPFSLFYRKSTQMAQPRNSS